MEQYTGLQHKNILLVEDDGLQAQQMQNYFQQNHNTIIRFQNGETALAHIANKIRQNAVDWNIMLIDMDLSKGGNPHGIDGKQTALQIMQKHLGIPIVLMTHFLGKYDTQGGDSGFVTIAKYEDLERLDFFVSNSLQNYQTESYISLKNGAHTKVNKHLIIYAEVLSKGILEIHTLQTVVNTTGQIDFKSQTHHHHDTLANFKALVGTQHFKQITKKHLVNQEHCIAYKAGKTPFGKYIPVFSFRGKGSTFKGSTKIPDTKALVDYMKHKKS